MKLTVGLTFDQFIRRFNPKPGERFIYVENSVIFNSFVCKRGNTWDFGSYKHTDGRVYTTGSTPDNATSLGFLGPGLITEYFPHAVKVGKFIP